MDKSAIKKAYKESKRSMGVYSISFIQSDRKYVGSAVDLQARINRHRAELKSGSYRKRELQKAWNSFGESAFKFEILDVLDHEENIRTNPSEELRVLLEMWVHRLEKEGHSIVTL